MPRSRLATVGPTQLSAHPRIVSWDHELVSSRGQGVSSFHRNRTLHACPLHPPNRRSREARQLSRSALVRASVAVLPEESYSHAPSDPRQQPYPDSEPNDLSYLRPIRIHIKPSN